MKRLQAKKENSLGVKETETTPIPCVFMAFVLPHTLESLIQGVHGYKLACNTMCSVGPRREIEICPLRGFPEDFLENVLCGLQI